MTLYDVATGTDVTPQDAQWATQTGWMYSPDGKVLVTQGKTPTTMDLWNSATRAHLLTLTFPSGVRERGYAVTGHAARILSVPVKHAYNPTPLTHIRPPRTPGPAGPPPS